MSSDDGTKPWDAPDPAQLRITTAPAARRGRKTPPSAREVNLPAASPPLPSPRLRPPGALDGTDPAEAPPRPAPRPPRRPAVRVGRPTGEIVPESAEAPPPPPTEPVAINAPPIPRPHYPHGAPAPAVVDTRGGTARLSVGTGADWRDIDEPVPKETTRAPSVPRWAITAGTVIGGGGLLLACLAVGTVVGGAVIDAFTAKEEVDSEAAGSAALAPPPPPPAEPTLPAFPGGEVNALAGTDVLVPIYPVRRAAPPPVVFVDVSLPGQTSLVEPSGPQALPPQNDPDDVPVDGGEPAVPEEARVPPAPSVPLAPEPAPILAPVPAPIVAPSPDVTPNLGPPVEEAPAAPAPPPAPSDPPREPSEPG